MELVYVVSPSIVLLLDDNLNIARAWRWKASKSLPACVVRATHLDATADGRPGFEGDTFETDGLGAIRLLWWIINERPDASQNFQFKRFLALFNNNPLDALKASFRVFSGTHANAPGEVAYFCAQQWRHHPNEMAAIAKLGEIARRG